MWLLYTFDSKNVALHRSESQKNVKHSPAFQKTKQKIFLKNLKLSKKK